MGTEVTSVLEPFYLDGISEPLTYTLQQNGPAAQRSVCKTILIGLETGNHYCASPGCCYSAEKWSSVFSHRAVHTRTAKTSMMEPLPQQSAGPAAPTAMLANRVAELEALLARERQRSSHLEQRLNVIRRAVA